MPITRTFVIAALSLGGASHGAFAQNYPARAARIIVPWTPGGTADLLARIAGQKFSETWGQQFIVDNRPGASGLIGTEVAAKAAPDGHTLLMIDPALVVAQNLLEKPGFDPLKDFTYVMPTMRSYMGLVINSKLPFKSLGEFLAHAKAKPNDNSSTGTPAMTAPDSAGRFQTLSM